MNADCAPGRSPAVESGLAQRPFHAVVGLLHDLRVPRQGLPGGGGFQEIAARRGGALRLLPATLRAAAAVVGIDQIEIADNVIHSGFIHIERSREARRGSPSQRSDESALTRGAGRR